MSNTATTSRYIVRSRGIDLHGEWPTFASAYEFAESMCDGTPLPVPAGRRAQGQGPEVVEVEPYQYEVLA